MKHSRRRQLIKELREHIKNGVPYSLTFKPKGNLTKKQQEVLEADLKYHFEIWADTWILPWIDMIEQRWLGKDKQS